MSDNDKSFESGGVVWVKCGTLFWPGEVQSFQSLPADVKEDFEDDVKPKLVVKFFDEDGYEFLNDTKHVFPYNCSRKEEFIKKGVVKSRSKSKEGATTGWFAKFPNDVVKCERLTGGDPELLEKEPYVEKTERVNYKEIFGTPDDNEKGSKGAQKRKAASPVTSVKKKPKRGAITPAVATPPRPISHPRFKGGTSDHKVKILPQPSTPYHLDLAVKQEKARTSTGGSNYNCSICDFSSTRLNVFILHNKSHKNDVKGGVAPNRRTPTQNDRGNNALKRTPESTPKRKDTKTPASKTPASKTPASKTPTSKTPTSRNNKKNNSANNGGVAAPVQNEQKVVPAASSKTPRLSKKRKEAMAKEKEKKEETRNKILGDWSSDEEDEQAERLKIKETLGLPSDEEEEAAYMGDDNLNQDFSDDDNEVYHSDEETKKEESKKIEDEKDESDKKGEKKDEDTEKEEVTNNDDNAEKEAEKNKTDVESAVVIENPSEELKDEKFEEKNASNDIEEESEESTDKNASNGVEKEGSHLQNGTNGKNDDEPFDIDKVLEETRVPELPAEKEEEEESQSSLLPKKRKSVTFSTKEIASKKIRVMQPQSNLTDPWDLEDEFIEDSSPTSYAAAKKMLREAKAKRLAANEADQPKTDPSVERKNQEQKNESIENSEPKENDEAKRLSETPSNSDHREKVNSDDAPSKPGEARTHQEVTNGQQRRMMQEAAAAAAATSNSDETYILLVDDGSGAVDSLNSQTLYIDPSTLASGDLSNVVLMAADDKVTSANNSAAVSSKNDIFSLTFHQRIVTTVDTSGGVATVPGIASSSDASKVPLISTQATPTAPVMAPAEVCPKGNSVENADSANDEKNGE